MDLLGVLVGNPHVATPPPQIWPGNAYFFRQRICALLSKGSILKDHSSLIPRVIVDHQVEIEPRHLAVPHRIACVIQAPRISGIWRPSMFAAIAAPKSINPILSSNANEARSSNSSYQAGFYCRTKEESSYWACFANPAM
jgi:hypothetical protein